MGATFAFAVQEDVTGILVRGALVRSTNRYIMKFPNEGILVNVLSSQSY